MKFAAIIEYGDDKDGLKANHPSRICQSACLSVVYEDLEIVRDRAAATLEREH